MKKISILLGVFMLVFTSCNIESLDDDIGSSSNSIVGKWRMIDYTYTGETITSAQGQELSTSFVGEAFDMTNTITFSEDPNVITSEGSFSLRLTSNTLGQTSTQTITGLEAINDGNWERDGDELFTFTDMGEGVMNIDKLTESILVLSVSQEEDLSQAGFRIISNIDAIVTLERVTD
ncbi:hypothetical protein [Seonamhaeicola marinus]|uniref:Lipocalin-like domain-containing protein n=1 Tax=Seonamhaeicola marinus TaxID=1912246 RepID=A0A5D0HN62_9FLAO|nr:hypothetical protein [Seonamhaeicola marinus]TYA71789.1 hypothetical protein FUA24_19755 [Seonamhaeicola marinus]